MVIRNELVDRKERLADKLASLGEVLNCRLYLTDPLSVGTQFHVGLI